MGLPKEGELFADKYEIGATLGSGGFGRVVRATDVVVGRPVAVKILKPDVANLSSGQRFLREMRAIAQLESPHTLTLFDYGRTSSGLLYMVTELVEGYDLSELLVRREKLSAGDTVHILLQVLYSLREAHAKGLIHRDIKPSNIRLSQFNDDPHRVKVLDFGLARSFEDDTARVTKTGHVIGTPRYMSPEQLNGLDLTPSTDVYSAGLVALEMLEGRAAMMDKLSAVTPLRVSRSERVPEELANIIERMAERDSSRRYPDAASVVQELRPLRRAFSLPALPEVPRVEPQAPSPREAGGEGESTGLRSRKRSLVLTIGAVVAALVGAVGYKLVVDPPRTAEPAVSTRALPPALLAAPTAPPDVAVNTPPRRKEKRETPHEVEPSARMPFGVSADGLCGGRPPPFHGEGELTRAGAFGGVYSIYVPQTYDGRRKYGLLIRDVRPVRQHHVGGKPVGRSVEDQRRYHGEPLATQMVQRVADELDLVVLNLEMREETTQKDDIYDAVDAAAESLCVDATRVWALSTHFDFPSWSSLWCSSPVVGLITTELGGSGPAGKATCRLPRLHFYHPKVRDDEPALNQLPYAAWSRWQERNLCRGGTKRQTEHLECERSHCATPTEHCTVTSEKPRPDLRFTPLPDHEPTIIEFIRHAEKTAERRR